MCFSQMGAGCDLALNNGNPDHNKLIQVIGEER